MANEQRDMQALLDQVWIEVASVEAYHVMMQSKFTDEQRRAYESGGIAAAQTIKSQLSYVAKEFGLRYPPPDRNLKLVVDNDPIKNEKDRGSRPGL